MRIMISRWDVLIMPEGHYLTFNSSMSRDLMEDYLVVEDGKTKRFQDVPGYATKKFNGGVRKS